MALFVCKGAWGNGALQARWMGAMNVGSGSYRSFGWRTWALYLLASLVLGGCSGGAKLALEPPASMCPEDVGRRCVQSVSYSGLSLRTRAARRGTDAMALLLQAIDETREELGYKMSTPVSYDGTAAQIKWRRHTIVSELVDGAPDGALGVTVGCFIELVIRDGDEDGMVRIGTSYMIVSDARRPGRSRLERDGDIERRAYPHMREETSAIEASIRRAISKLL
jgi:hypothetical protein